MITWENINKLIEKIPGHFCDPDTLRDVVLKNIQKFISLYYNFCIKSIHVFSNFS